MVKTAKEIKIPQKYPFIERRNWLLNEMIACLRPSYTLLFQDAETRKENFNEY